MGGAGNGLTTGELHDCDVCPELFSWGAPLAETPRPAAGAGCVLGCRENGVLPCDFRRGEARTVIKVNSLFPPETPHGDPRGGGAFVMSEVPLYRGTVPRS